jgi:pimeloyl-ACP methyl ester carboxylesterase
LREQLVSDGTLTADESLHLAGHSLGAYLAAQYALKNPEKIDSLILISPVGIPEQPALSTRTKGSQMSWGMYTASSAWAMNITPQSVVRMAGKFNPIHDSWCEIYYRKLRRRKTHPNRKTTLVHIIRTQRELNCEERSREKIWEQMVTCGI